MQSKQRDLAGLRVLVTRPIHQAQTLSTRIRQCGGIPILLPGITISPVADPSVAIDFLNKSWDAIIYTSANAVRFADNLMKNRTLPQAAHIAAIGMATATALMEKSCIPNLLPMRQNSEGLLELPLLAQPLGMRILIVRGMGGRGLLESSLTTRGALVSIAEVYQRDLPDINIETALLPGYGNFDVLIITSGEILHNIISIFGAAWQAKLLMTQLIVISERLEMQALKLGFTRIVRAMGADDDSLLNCLNKIG